MNRDLAVLAAAIMLLLSISGCVAILGVPVSPECHQTGARYRPYLDTYYSGLAPAKFEELSIEDQFQIAIFKIECTRPSSLSGARAFANNVVRGIRFALDRFDKPQGARTSVIELIQVVVSSLTVGDPYLLELRDALLEKSSRLDSKLFYLKDDIQKTLELIEGKRGKSTRHVR